MTPRPAGTRARDAAACATSCPTTRVRDVACDVRTRRVASQNAARGPPGRYPGRARRRLVGKPRDAAGDAVVDAPGRGQETPEVSWVHGWEATAARWHMQHWPEPLTLTVRTRRPPFQVKNRVSLRARPAVARPNPSPTLPRPLLPATTTRHTHTRPRTGIITTCTSFSPSSVPPRPPPPPPRLPRRSPS